MTGSGSGRSRSVLRPSLLQRLLGGKDARVRPNEDLRTSLRELRDEVVRDLALLLNTRATDSRPFGDLPGVADSVLGYGLPDLTNYSPSSDDDMEALKTVIAETIRRFEPRLDPKSIKVERPPGAGLQGNADNVNSRSFRISAILHVEPIVEQIAFDTRVDLDSGAVHVEDAGA